MSLSKLHRLGDVLRIGMGREDLMLVEKVILDFRHVNPTRRRKYLGHHFKGNLVARYHCEVKAASRIDVENWNEARETAEF